MGNICRSPTAHGVLAAKVNQEKLQKYIRVDSAGTHNFYPKSPPDQRAQEHARKRGYDLSDIRARQVRPADFENSDLILAMDHGNARILIEQCPPEHVHKIRRLTEFCSKHDSEEVPDPYYGGPRGFELVLDLVEDACDNLLARVKRTDATP